MEDSDEIWKKAKGFEDYEVSNLGRVRSIERVVSYKGGSPRLRKGRLLKPWKYNRGYLMVSLWQDGCRTHKSIHRLVAQAFVENPNPALWTQINHIDENPSNNRADNLEWCCQSYNNSYGGRMKRIAEALSKPVEAFDSNGIVVHRFASTMDAQRNGFDSPNVSNCCNGKLKTFKGLRWRFIHSSEA